jgi:tetratricopeptide (TPR) repeat protein
MSDEAPTGESSPAEHAEQKRKRRARQRGLFADPVVRFMVYASVGLVVLYLAAVVGVLGTGVTAHTSPRTAAERELMLASARITPETKGDAWAPYINTLIATGDYTGARATLVQARASAAATASVPGLDLAEARLAHATGDDDAAVVLADKAMKSYQATFDARVAKAKAEGTELSAVTPGENYYDAALLKAYALEKLGRWKDAIAMFDTYLKVNRTASDIFIDRGNAKIEVNDKTGAEKDFREALRFVPYDEEAKAGLKKIGVAE